jgi:hypothetical protein
MRLFDYLVQKKREDNIFKCLQNRLYLIEQQKYQWAKEPSWQSAMDAVTEDLKRLANGQFELPAESI